MPETGIRRVLMTTDTVGGVWTFALELAEGLAAHDTEVVLVALGGEPAHDQTAEAIAIPNLCLLTSNFRLEWMEEPWDDIEASREWLVRLEREYRPDLVHLNSFGHGDLPWSAPTVLTAHSTVTSWFTAVKGEAAPASWNRYRELVARSMNAVDLVTAPSAALARELGQRGCRVIPNGRNPAKFYAAAKEPFIFTAGRLWDEAKNLTAVAEIAGNLPWPVYVAGESRDMRTGGCHALGRLSTAEMAGWYARAAIYAMPARYEPFGLSILEAALSGCALVLGEIPSLREIWGGNALYAAPDDTAALQRALQALIEDPGLRESMARRARAHATQFTGRRTAQLYLEAYADAAAARSRQCVS